MIGLETIIASVIAITAIAGLVLQQLWRMRHQYGLRWAILEPKSMMGIAEEIADDLKIHYKDRIIVDMTKYEFILHNTGLKPIEKADIVVPLKWVGPGTVLGARVVVTDPPVDLSWSIQEREVEFSWPIFNQGCMSLVEILCEGSGRNEQGELLGQIRNIPDIDKKRVTIRDVDEIRERQRLRMNLMRMPRFMQLLNRIFQNRWVICGFLGLFVIYIYTLTLLFISIYLEMSTLLAVGVGILFAIFVGGVYFFSRNPYSKLVKKGRERAKKASNGK